MQKVEESRSFSPRSEKFQALLDHLAAEHCQIVNDLQAEITQLNLQLSATRTGIVDIDCEVRQDQNTVVLPSPAGFSLPPRSPRSQGHNGLQSEYSSPDREPAHEEHADHQVNGKATGRPSASPSQTLPKVPEWQEWVPMEDPKREQAHRAPKQPADASRSRNEHRPVKAKELEESATVRFSDGSEGSSPDQAALGKAFAIAQAMEDAEFSETLPSTSMPMSQEPTNEVLDSRENWKRSLYSESSSVDEDGGRNVHFELEPNNVTSPRDPSPRDLHHSDVDVPSPPRDPSHYDMKRSIINGTGSVGSLPFGSLRLANSSSERGSGNSSNASHSTGAGALLRNHLSLNSAWRTVLDALPEASQDEGSVDIIEQIRTGGEKMQKTASFRRPLSKGRSLAEIDKHLGEMCVLHPNNKWRVAWDLLGFGMLIWDLISIPLQVFSLGTDGFTGFYKRFMRVVAVFSTIFWTMDLIINFFTGFYSAQGYLRIELRAVIKRYLTTWFPMDFFLAVTDWVTLCLGILAGSDFMRIGKTVARFMRIVRLLRFVKLGSTVQEIIDRIQSEYIVTLVGVARILIFIIVMNHYIACGWYGLSQFPSVSRTWLDKALLDTPHEDKQIPYLYTTSLHWSLTQFTPASMEIVPQNAYERAYNVVIIVIGVVAFSSFVSSITGAMTYVRIMNSRRTEQNAALRRFFTERKISQDMACRVWHWSQNSRSARIFKESDVATLSLLPDRTRRDLRYELHAPVLQAHPAFYQYHHLDLHTFRQICDTATIESSLKPGQAVFEESKNLDKMFFVLYGGVDYHQTKINNREARRLSTRSAQAVNKIQAGNWACEVALWVNQARMSGEFTGGLSNLYGAELMTLRSQDLLEVTQASPASMVYLAQYAELFVAECCSDKRMSTAAPYVFFNDLDELQELAQRAIDTLVAQGRSSMANDRDSQMDLVAKSVQKTKPRSTWMPNLNMLKKRPSSNSDVASAVNSRPSGGKTSQNSSTC